MSYILEDPDVGRCKNFRTVTHSDHHIEHLRCLDYENVRHECSFPEPTHVVSTAAHNIFTSTKSEPKPWVKPNINEEK